MQYQEWAIAITDAVFMWMALELWTWKTGAESNMDFESPAQGVLEEKNISNGASGAYLGYFSKECGCFLPFYELAWGINLKVMDAFLW